LQVLGFTNQLDYYVNAEDKALFQKWDALVKAKDFAKADQLRNKLIKKGLI
jgi:cysteinyl-tRNA synthetase